MNAVSSSIASVSGAGIAVIAADRGEEAAAVHASVIGAGVAVIA